MELWPHVLESSGGGWGSEGASPCTHRVCVFQILFLESLKIPCGIFSDGGRGENSGSKELLGSGGEEDARGVGGEASHEGEGNAGWKASGGCRRRAG